MRWMLSEEGVSSAIWLIGKLANPDRLNPDIRNH